MNINPGFILAAEAEHQSVSQHRSQVTQFYGAFQQL